MKRKARASRQPALGVRNPGPAVLIYDTTLRDGSQGEGVSMSVEDKLDIARQLDDLGVAWIEGGWPGSNPKDVAFFEQGRRIRLRRAKLAAFGSTRRAGIAASADSNLRALVAAKTPTVTIFGKSWDLHVTDALRTTLDENLRMIADSVKYLKAHCGQVVYDAEHFFDGYRANPGYALQTLEAAAGAGADWLVLCDTNGGSLPDFVHAAAALVAGRFNLPVGIHTHNDAGMAAANSIEAVRAGATMVQGTMNGLGERCGNADLTAVIPVVELKLGRRCLPAGNLPKITAVSRYVCEITNQNLRDNQPFVGRSAFAHKGGVHVSAVQRNALTYEHVRPEAVGNARRVLVSELSGRSNVLALAGGRYDLDRNPEKMKEILDRVRELENEGYQFESAEASFDLVVRKAMGDWRPFFRLHGFRVFADLSHGGSGMVEASIQLEVDGRREHTAAEGNGPVNALDGALRKALLPFYPQLAEVELVDYKVRVINAKAATAARVRVTIESSDRHERWRTVGVHENIIQASFRALVDSIEYKLLRERDRSRRTGQRKA
ncbi:MAG TPA: citramalate synthase [Planctomycetota bacterium]|nr:citramalate synthase [Planctomycetota bacterium]